MQMYVFLSCCGLVAVHGDVYMHNPRGSNNKLTEQSNNAQNQNRLFDSQNNAAGGYQVGDNCVPNCKTENGGYDAQKPGSQEGVMYYYHGSEVYVEWTVQHGCGTPGTNDNCNMVLQYMCSSDALGLRDGKDPDSGTRRRSGGGNNNNAQGANKEASDDPERGRHETFEFFDACRKRQRNKGLYVADKNLNENIGAAATRQNPNGNRRGLECAEERDYYPYWHPTEWRDAAVLTSNGEHCGMYQNQSQNVRGKGFCDIAVKVEDGEEVPATLAPEDQIPNNPEECKERGGAWKERAPWNIPSPDCLALPESRDNHLGNTYSGRPQYWIWEVPETIPDNDECVLRLRYNISTGDYIKKDDPDFDPFQDLDRTFNGANAPLKSDPKDDFIGLGMQRSGPLQMQVNTQQFGRTFEDRSHVFRVRKRPSSINKESRIVNYNVRGRRGNIVQTYPAVEYDFVPQDVEVSLGDYVHFQWTGSDANANGNAGNGKAGTDRNNLVQIASRSGNKPIRVEDHTLFYNAKNANSDEKKAGQALVERFAFLDQQQYAESVGSTCPASVAEAAELNSQDDRNCHQLNAAPAYFDGGLVEMKVLGQHHVASTRNNDFSNRSQKATIIVKWRSLLDFLKYSPPLHLAIVALIIVALSVLVYLVGSSLYAYMNPTSSSFSKRNRPLLLRLPCLHRMVAVKERERQAYKEAVTARWITGDGYMPTGGSKENTADAAVNASPVEATPMALPPVLPRKMLQIFTDRSALWLLVLANVAVGIIGFARNWGKGFNSWYVVAKTGGYMLDFDLSVLLLPTLRSAQTVMRQVPALESIFADPIAFHVQVACCVLFATCLHVVGHILHMADIANSPVFFPATTPKQEMSGTSWWVLLLDPRTRCAPLTGIFTLLLMAPMFLTASDKVRRRTFDFTKLPKSFQDAQAWFILLLVGMFMWPVMLYRRCFSRRSANPESLNKVGGFRIFWAVHGNWLIVYVLLLVHGPNFWIWFLWPMVLVLCDRLLQRQRRQASIRLQSVDLLKANVMKLTFAVPRTFDYQAGQYVQLCCKQIGVQEWHPFTVSSAPEEDHLSVHIRCPDELDWCSALRRRLVEEPVAILSQGTAKAMPGCRIMFKRDIHHGLPGADEEDLKYDHPQIVQIPASEGQSAQTFTARVQEDLKKLPTGLSKKSLESIVDTLPQDAVQMRLDGPHGAPSQNVWKHRAVVLVGAGIGVTPFASILRSVQLRQRKFVQRSSVNVSGQEEPLAHHSLSAWRQSMAPKSTPDNANVADEDGWQPCENVYFYWLCRGQDEFEWFYDMLREAVGTNQNRRVEVNLFQTGEVELSKVKELGCGFHQYFGRPNWGRIFPKLAEQHPKEDIGVFLCGPSAIRGDLQQGVRKAKDASAKHGSSFVIHAENF